jgi:hypothetical protein
MLRWSCLSLAIALCVSGCIDPKQEFDAFGERLDAKKRADMANMPQPGDDGGTCESSVEAVAGTYYFVMRPSVAADSPIPLVMTLEPSGESELSLSLQPVAVKDGKTPVGPPSKGKFQIEGNAFTVPPLQVSIPGAADAVLPDTDLVVEIDMKGSLCAQSGEMLDFLCGDVNGKVVMPDVSLDGSTFGAHRMVGDELPLLSPSCAEREGIQ